MSQMDGMVSKARTVNGVPTSLLDLGFKDVGLDVRCMGRFWGAGAWYLSRPPSGDVFFSFPFHFSFLLSSSSFPFLRVFTTTPNSLLMRRITGSSVARTGPTRCVLVLWRTFVRGTGVQTLGLRALKLQMRANSYSSARDHGTFPFFLGSHPPPHPLQRHSIPSTQRRAALLLTRRGFLTSLQ